MTKGAILNNLYYPIKSKTPSASTDEKVSYFVKRLRRGFFDSITR